MRHFRLELKKLLSHFKSAPRKFLKSKVSIKQKTLSLGPTFPFARIFEMSFTKTFSYFKSSP